MSLALYTPAAAGHSQVRGLPGPGCMGTRQLASGRELRTVPRDPAGLAAHPLLTFKTGFSLLDSNLSSAEGDGKRLRA